MEFILPSDVFVIDALNNPAVGNATESSVLGPVSHAPLRVHSPTKRLNRVGEKGEYIYMEARVFTWSGEPIPAAVIEMWETDDKDYNDTQCTRRPEPNCRGRLRTYRASVPVAYPVPGNASVG